MIIKLSEDFIKEFIDADLDIIDGTDNEFKLNQTFTGLAKKNGQRPYTTDDSAKEGKIDWFRSYLNGYGGYGASVNEDHILDKSNRTDLVNLYDETILKNDLDNLLKGIERVKNAKSTEQFLDILSIIYTEIKTKYELEKQTISDSK